MLAGVLAIYLPGLDNAPVYDDAFLTDGRLFTLYGSWTLRERWLSYGSFVAVRELLGDGWWKQRLVNVSIHCAVVAALWAFYREVLRALVLGDEDDRGVPPPPATPALGLALGMFALNPVATYAVAYLIQRSILLATLFTVLALWLVARALRNRRPWLFGVAFACYVLAVLSKEHAILAPLAAIPVYLVVARPSGKRLAVLAGAGFGAMVVAAALLSFRYGEILGKPFDEFSRVYLAQLARLAPDAPRQAWPLSIMNQGWLFFEYGVRWFLPNADWMSINLRPPFPIRWLTFPQVLGPVAYVALLGAGAWLVLRYRDARALLGLSLLLPALLFPTEFVTVWVQDPFVLYRSYLWAIGVPGMVLCLALGAPPRVLLAAGLGLAAVFVWQGIDRVRSMATPERAWSDAIAKLPRDPRAVGRWFPYLNRGADSLERGDLKAAMKDFEVSASLGDQGMGTFNMGAVLASAGRHQQALAAFDLARRQGYDLYNLPFQRGLSLAALGRPADAYAEFRATEPFSPPSPTRELLWLHLGRAALQLNRPAEALGPLGQLVAAEPANREARYLLAMAYTGSDRAMEALPLLETLAREDPKPPVFYARALAHHALGRKAEATADIERVLAADPRNPTLLELQARIKALR